ncbi:methylmalonyl Co-A mutase-associated GTPase MeaB [Reichenbachiella agarivorans]|uniref:Methylmalonyl Co-A mutase-associated GTPase MeaB n=1 Tax=Reichenbachiella agarivorans TaxID=2979464 RepID=A0ABY6CKJ0_9BACT|nr:methylmalonyl Co-A mutase-associated GTPase MeaB [Reichenbachiella agarivorans]UXP31040.1 methylmalonyl Co-A mutase-associated GTPase MeaB [Reichenbachiella agarivorans]
MNRKDATYYVDAIRSGDRKVLSRAISIVESTRSSDMELSQRILTQLGHVDSTSLRIGITGSPGVGKSTFIESIGQIMTKEHQLAILAIDPSSPETGGSILGDKTRMNELSRNPKVYIRPSATYNYYGGVNQSTYKTILLCEAAGFDRVIIETVGVGQSEYMVRGMVDFFLLLAQPAAGDELQGIKKGVMEMVDGIVVNKCDGELVQKAMTTQSQLKEALHYSQDKGKQAPVLCCSAVTGEKIHDVYQMIEKACAAQKYSGLFDQNRTSQRSNYFVKSIEVVMLKRLLNNPEISAERTELLEKLAEGTLDTFTAVDEFMRWFENRYL